MYTILCTIYLIVFTAIGNSAEILGESYSFFYNFIGCFLITTAYLQLLLATLRMHRDPHQNRSTVRCFFSSSILGISSMTIFIVTNGITNYVYPDGYTYEYMWNFWAVLSAFMSLFSACLGICFHNLPNITQ